MRFIRWLKEVFAKMFGKNTLNKAIGTNDIALTSEMIQRMELWDKMLIGKAPWINNDVVSLGLERAICREFANITLSETETYCTDEVIDEIFQKGLENLGEKFQDGLAYGCMAIKPIADTGKSEIVTGNNIVPIEFGADGDLLKCAFIQTKQINEETTYYRIEIHESTSEGLIIRNRAFKGNNGDIGKEVPLETVDEWANLIPDVMYQGMKGLDFGYYCNPIPNRIDKSNVAVSIFEDAVEQIKMADVQMSRLDWELESAERMIFADFTAVEKTKQGWKLPINKNRLIVDVDIEDHLETFDPNVREAEFRNVLNEYIKKVEDNVQLARGDLSRNEIIEKTATEIITTKQRKYQMVNAIQKKLEKCLEQYGNAIAFYLGKYNSNFKVVTSFHDTILTDENEERAQDRMDVANGSMSIIEYRMKWYNEDEDTAKKKIAENMAFMNGLREPIS